MSNLFLLWMLECCWSAVLKQVCFLRPPVGPEPSQYHSLTSTTCSPGLETWSRHDSPNPALWVKRSCECESVQHLLTEMFSSYIIKCHALSLSLTINKYWYINNIDMIRVIFGARLGCLTFCASWLSSHVPLLLVPYVQIRWKTWHVFL